MEPQIIKQIAIDMDGVVADWVISAAAVGVSEEYRSEWISRHDHRLDNMHEVNDDDVKAAIVRAGVDFWVDMPTTSERFHGLPTPAQMYHNACKIVGEGNVYFLTAVGDDTAPDASKGKVLWLRKHLGNDFSEFFLCRARNKRRLAARGRMLIDDHPKNIDQWQTDGGVGWLFQCHYPTADGDMAGMLDLLSKKI
jgi:5'(3')-deoxyribonucleotidase